MLAAPSRAHDGLQSPHTVAVQNCRIGSALASTCWITSDIRPPYRYLSSGRRAWGLARREKLTRVSKFISNPHRTLTRVSLFDGGGRMELVSRQSPKRQSLARRRGRGRGGLQRRSGQDWPREGPRRRSFTALLLSFFDGGLVGRWMPSEAKPNRRMSEVAM